jgi:hypothetical protein
MLWLPCTTSTSGNGPSPSGYHTRPLIGSFLKSNPQYFARDFAISGVADTSADPSTVRVLSTTESRKADRRLSVPLPYTSARTVSVPFSPGFGAEIAW